MRIPNKKLWKLAPVWVVLFSTGTTLAKQAGERYLLERKWQLKWSDVGTALSGALFGYVSFRLLHGNKTEGVATR